MNILYYGKNTYFNAYLKNLGHSFFTVGESNSCDFPISGVISAHSLLLHCKEKGFIPDVFFYADDSTLPHIFHIEELKIPTIFYSIDTYCHAWHEGFSRAFDYCFYAQKEESHKFPEYSSLMPLFSCVEYEIEPRAEWLKNRDIPVSFVGTLGHKNNTERTTFFSLYKAFVPLFVTSGKYEPIYKRSRIVLNQSAVGEINFRTFEAMALGCACLCDHMPTDKNAVAEIFQFGVNSLPTYPKNDVAKAIDFSVHWLSKEKEEQLYDIAKAGNEYVLQNHTARVRAKTLDTYFHTFLLEKIWEKRLVNLAERKKSIKQAYEYLGNHQDVFQPLREIYQNISKKY